MQCPQTKPFNIGMLHFAHGFTFAVSQNVSFPGWRKIVGCGMTDWVQAMSCSINVRIENSQPGKLNGSSSVGWETCHEASWRSYPSNAPV